MLLLSTVIWNVRRRSGHANPFLNRYEVRHVLGYSKLNSVCSKMLQNRSMDRLHEYARSSTPWAFISFCGLIVIGSEGRFPASRRCYRDDPSLSLLSMVSTSQEHCCSVAQASMGMLIVCTTDMEASDDSGPKGHATGAFSHT